MLSKKNNFNLYQNLFKMNFREMREKWNRSDSRVAQKFEENKFLSTQIFFQRTHSFKGIAQENEFCQMYAYWRILDKKR